MCMIWLKRLLNPVLSVGYSSHELLYLKCRIQNRNQVEGNMPKEHQRCIGGKFTGRQMDCTNAVARLANMVVEHPSVGKICFDPIVSGLRCDGRVTVKVSNDTNCISLTVIQGNSKQKMFVYCSSLDETWNDILAMFSEEKDITIKYM